VPAAQRLRADRKAGPSLGREQAAGRSEQASVGAGYRGRFPERLRIAGWWRSTMISSSRSRPPRTSTPRRTHRSR
jgi:hypothetical protein